MRSVVVVGAVFQIMMITIVWSFVIPKTMAIELQGGTGGVYTSEVFHVPVRIKDVTLDVSVLMDTYLRVWGEIRIGEDYIRFHFNNMSISYHVQYDLLEFFGSLSTRDVSLTMVVDTDGVIQDAPSIFITYYGLW